MNKRNLPYIAFRCLQIIASLMLYYRNAYVLIIVILITALILDVIKNRDEIKRMKPPGGIANWMTTLRGAALIFLISHPAYFSFSTIALIGTVVSVLDFFDGYLARKLKEVTTLGGHLDEEMDALYFICFGYLLYIHDLCGAYILIPGIAKYAKDLLVSIIPDWFLKPIRMPEAKWIAGISFILYLTPFIFPANIYPAFTIAACMALCGSLLAEVIIRFSGPEKNKAFISK
jgi:hypothetical protein